MAVRTPSLTDLGKAALRTPIPHALRADLGLGALILVLFLVQVFTGILLSLYYQPSPGAVSESVQFIMRDVNWGWLMRGLHHWASTGLIVMCCLHLARVLLAARYRSGRSWAWYLGVFVLLFVALSAFSGELLTWDNQAYWRVRQILADVETIPLIGPDVADIVRGGPEVSATTLSRTYSAHTQFVPWLVWMLLVVNLALLVREVRRANHGGDA